MEIVKAKEEEKQKVNDREEKKDASFTGVWTNAQKTERAKQILRELDETFSNDEEKGEG